MIRIPSKKELRERRLQAQKEKDEGITLTFSEYELSNLRELIRAIGYPATIQSSRNVLDALNTGDWLGTIFNKIPEGKYFPNTPWYQQRKAVEDRAVSESYGDFR